MSLGRRIVTGHFETLSGGSETRPITYTLIPGTLAFTEDGLVSDGPITDTPDEDGDTATTLWTNEEGYEPTAYLVMLPDGKQGRFTLPASADPISLSVLLRASLFIEWAHNAFGDAIAPYIAAIYAAFASTADIALGDALVGYRAAGTGAISRTLH